MIDPDPREQAALRAALKNMAELMAEIGWTTRFQDLSEQQALALDTENQRLERRVTDLDDDVTIELLARSQQGLVRPGEVPYVLIAPEVDVPRIRDAPQQVVSEDDLLDRLLAWLRARVG